MSRDKRCFDSTLDTSPSTSLAAENGWLAGSRQGQDVVGRVPEPRSECRPDLDRVRAKYTRALAAPEEEENLRK